MSWDPRLECDACGLPIGQWDYTHNTNPMLRAAAPSGSAAWEVIDGLPAPIGASILNATVKELEADPGRFKAMNPANGWGDYASLLEVLREMRDAGITEVPATWRTDG